MFFVVVVLIFPTFQGNLFNPFPSERTGQFTVVKTPNFTPLILQAEDSVLRNMAEKHIPCYKSCRDRINPAWFKSNQCEGLLPLFVFEFVLPCDRASAAPPISQHYVLTHSAFPCRTKNGGDKLTSEQTLFCIGYTFSKAKMIFRTMGGVSAGWI